MILKKIIPLSILAGMLSSPQLVTAHTDGACAHQSSAVTSNPDWMKFIDGNKRVSDTIYTRYPRHNVAKEWCILAKSDHDDVSCDYCKVHSRY